MNANPPTMQRYSRGARWAMILAAVAGFVVAVAAVGFGAKFVLRSWVFSRMDNARMTCHGLANGLTQYQEDMGAFMPWTVTDRGPELNLKFWGKAENLILQTYLPFDLVDPFVPEGRNIRYWSDSDGWTIWSVGPNATLDLTDPRDYGTPGLNASNHLTEFQYDPTNGLFSPGDMIYFYRRAADEDE